VQKRDPGESDHTPLSLAKIRELHPSGSLSLLDLCSVAATDMSRSEIRRLIHGGGVRVDREKIIDENTKIDVSTVRTLWIGKRLRFILVENLS
jgi:tyrosyl-tRNA synthetase